MNIREVSIAEKICMVLRKAHLNKMGSRNVRFVI